MIPLRPLALLALASLVSPLLQAEEAASPPPAEAAAAEKEKAPDGAVAKKGEAKSEEVPDLEGAPEASKSEFSDLGDFGSSEPVERKDLPSRGILSFEIKDRNGTFFPREHWEEYHFPFQAKRSGKYRVRMTYSLKASTLGVQLKLGEDRVKKTLRSTGGMSKTIYLGEVNIGDSGDQFMALYTPIAVGWVTFEMQELALIPTQESDKDLKAGADGTLHLLAKDATTWSENMRYEAKPEKDCLGYWTEADDFAEWEFQVDKPGKYALTVHQGCGAGGGSEVAVVLNGQELSFKVKDTGGFQNWEPVNVGEFAFDKAGTYRIAVKPQKKKGAAVMDIQKLVLAPVS